MKGRYPKGSNPSGRKGAYVGAWIDTAMLDKIRHEMVRKRISKSQWVRQAVYDALGEVMPEYERRDGR